MYEYGSKVKRDTREEAKHHRNAKRKNENEKNENFPVVRKTLGLIHAAEFGLVLVIFDASCA